MSLLIILYAWIFTLSSCFLHEFGHMITSLMFLDHHVEIYFSLLTCMGCCATKKKKVDEEATITFHFISHSSLGKLMKMRSNNYYEWSRHPVLWQQACFFVSGTVFATAVLFVFACVIYGMGSVMPDYFTIVEDLLVSVYLALLVQGGNLLPWDKTCDGYRLGRLFGIIDKTYPRDWGDTVIHTYAITAFVPLIIYFILAG